MKRLRIQLCVARKPQKLDKMTSNSLRGRHQSRKRPPRIVSVAVALPLKIKQSVTLKWRGMCTQPQHFVQQTTILDQIAHDRRNARWLSSWRRQLEMLSHKNFEMIWLED